MTLEFSRPIFEKISILNFFKIRSLGAELFVAGRRTDDRHDESKTLLGILRTRLKNALLHWTSNKSITD